MRGKRAEEGSEDYEGTGGDLDLALDADGPLTSSSLEIRLGDGIESTLDANDVEGVGGVDLF